MHVWISQCKNADGSVRVSQSVKGSVFTDSEARQIVTRKNIGNANRQRPTRFDHHVAKVDDDIIFIFHILNSFVVPLKLTVQSRMKRTIFCRNLIIQLFKNNN